MASKVRRVDVVNFYVFITQNDTKFALKIVIFLFKFVHILQEFSYYIKMHSSCTASFSSLYFFRTHSHHCQLLVIFITMAELFLSPKISHRTQPSRTRKGNNTRPTFSALRIWAEIHPLNNLISIRNHHSILL
jgi:hypothetical protein